MMLCQLDEPAGGAIPVYGAETGREKTAAVELPDLSPNAPWAVRVKETVKFSGKVSG